MVLMYDVVTDSLVEERSRVVRETADKQKEIMYLQNHGSRNTRIDAEDIVSHMTDYFN